MDGAGPETPDARTLRAAKRAEIDQRREQVAVLLLSHVPYRRIAEILGVGRSTVGDDVQAVRAGWRRRAEDAYEAHVAEELAKLDALERAWLPKALPHHPLHQAEHVSAAAAAALVVHRVGERRERLLGLTRPARFELTGADGGPVRVETVEEKVARVTRLLDEVGAKRAEREERESGYAAAGGDA